MLTEALDPTRELDLRQPSLGLAYLGAALKQHLGRRVRVVRPVGNLDNALRQHKPDLLAISSTSVRYDLACRMAEVAASLNVPTILGGIHITTLPESLSPHVVAGVIGEGERTLCELVEHMMEHDGFETASLHDIRGLVFYDGDRLVQTAPREPVDPLDQLPPPDRSLAVPSPEHAYMFTSRGCPYRCVFCASCRAWPGKVRFFSAERVVSEIEQLVVDHGVRVISFYDDLFIANRPRLDEIARLLHRRGLAGSVRFTCNARVNLVDDDLCRTLRRIGVVSVNLGLESGTDRVLSWLKGSGVTVEDNRRAIATIRRHGLLAQGSFIIGSPDETREEIEATYRFIREQPLSLVDVYVLRPYPGTPVWDEAVARGLASPTMDYGSITHRDVLDPDRLINLSRTIDSHEMKRIYARFMRLRYWKILKGLPRHPYRGEIVKAGLRTLRAALGGWRNRRG